MIGAYLQAFLRRYAGSAWASALPGVDSDVVKHVFTHDPEQYDFNVGDLPALFIFRTGSAKDPENLTADWRVNIDKVMTQWVLPPRQALKMPVAARAIGAVAKLVDSALRRGRDPSYVIAGDPDASATLEGSVVIRHAGLMKLEGGQWRAGTVAIAKHGGDARELFPAMIGQFTIAEVFEDLPGTEVPDSLGPTAEIVFPARVSATITANESDETAVEYRDPLTLVIP